MAAAIISLIVRLAAGMVCGYMMGVALSNNRSKFPDRYVFYMTVIVAVAFAVVTAPKSLLVISLALVAYIWFLEKTKVQPIAAFIWPIIWLAGAGMYLLRTRRGTSSASSLGTLAFVSLVAVCLLFLFRQKLLQKLRKLLTKLLTEEPQGGGG